MLYNSRKDFSSCLWVWLGWEPFGWAHGLSATLRQVLMRVRLGGWRCQSDIIIVWDETGWLGAGDVMHRKRADVCVRIWRKSEMSIRRQTRRINFWSSQTWGEVVPYGAGLLKLEAKWIRQHRRLRLSFLHRNLKLEFNKKVSYLNKKSCFRIPRFLCSIVMNIICPFRTWPYSSIWLHNSMATNLGEKILNSNITLCHNQFMAKGLGK